MKTLRMILNEPRSLFTPRQNGTRTLDLQIRGPGNKLKTDLSDHVVKGAAEHPIGKSLQKPLK